MPRQRLKAFDPHNTNAKARQHWERLQRGELKHAYDQPPAHGDDDGQRLSTSMRRFKAQVDAAKAAATGAAVKRQPAAADTEPSRAKRRKRRTADGGNAESAEGRQQSAASSSRKKRKAETNAEKSAEERAEEEAATRAAWEAKVSKMRRQPDASALSSASASRHRSSAALPSQPPRLPPPREFPTAEHIPFGTQVERPPQHLAELQQRLTKKGGKTAGVSSGQLSIEQYAVERQQAVAAYEQMRQRRRAAERGSTAMVSH
jgi:hypothetical protein